MSIVCPLFFGTELNELIYAGAKLFFKKIGIPSKSTIENLGKQAKMIKQKKDARIIRNRKEKTTQEKFKIELEEISQKVLAKDGRVEISTGHSKTMKENSINN